MRSRRWWSVVGLVVVAAATTSAVAYMLTAKDRIAASTIAAGFAAVVCGAVPATAWLSGQIRKPVVMPSQLDLATAYLAEEARDFWQEEAQRRGLLGSPALVLRWSPARRRMVDRTAVPVAPGSSSTPAEVARVFRGTAGRRLVVLGEVGGGKTGWVVLLILVESGPSVALIYALLSFYVFSLVAWPAARLSPDLGRAPRRLEGFRELGRAFLRRPATVAVMWVSAALPVGVGTTLLHGPTIGAYLAIAFGFTTALVYCMATPAPSARAISPAASFRSDRKVALTAALVIGLVMTSGAMWVGRGFATSLAIGVTASLDDAHRLGVLRQVGGVVPVPPRPAP